MRRLRTRLSSAGPVLAGLVILCTLGVTAEAGELQVKASIDHNRVGLDDSFTYSVTLSGEGAEGVQEPEIESLDGFRVRSTGRTQSYQILNMQATSSFIYTFTLQPEKTGDLTLGPAVVTYKGKEYRSNTVQVSVVEGSVAPRRSRSPFGDLDIFGRPRRGRADWNPDLQLETRLSKESVYQGSEVDLELVVIVGRDTRLTGVQYEGKPSYPGFWTRELKQGVGEGRRARSGDTGKVEYPIARTALFPTHSGDMEIPPIAVRLGVQNALSFSMFDSGKELTRRTESVSVKVLPLPAAGRPAEFPGTVGSYKLETAIDRNEVAAGEAVKLRVTLFGLGNLEMAADPTIPELADFRIFAPESSEEIRESSRGLTGRKSWEYVLIPSVSGDYTIPPIRYPSFDPAAKSYRTLETTPISLRVNDSQATNETESEIAAPSQRTVKMLDRDIMFIKTDPEMLTSAGRPLYRTPYFILALLFPPLINLVFLFVRRNRRRRNVLGPELRRRQAGKLSIKKLQKIQKEDVGDSQSVASSITSALLNYVSDRTGLPSAGMLAEDRKRELRLAGAGDRALEELESLLQDCDLLSFSGAGSAQTRTAELVERAIATIRLLEKKVSRNA